MDLTIFGVTLAGAVFAYALITKSRSHALRQREAEFFARHLHPGQWIEGEFRLLSDPR